MAVGPMVQGSQTKTRQSGRGSEGVVGGEKVRQSTEEEEKDDIISWRWEPTTRPP